MNLKPPEEVFFLVTQADVDKIDALVGALNLAVGEILEARPVRDRRPDRMHAQQDYDRRIGSVIYPQDPADFIDPSQSQFEF